jgi:hypothetical protein
VGIYSYGSQGFYHEGGQFAGWRRRHLRPPNLNLDEMDDPSEDPWDVRRLAESMSWMQVMIVGEDGSHGHCNPDVYFLVRTKDQVRLKA